MTITYDINTTWEVLLVIDVIWELVWKGLALWKAGKNNQKVWYVAILIINSVGLLPIIYLLTHRDHEAQP
jgi:hypothetical protein